MDSYVSNDQQMALHDKRYLGNRLQKLETATVLWQLICCYSDIKRLLREQILNSVAKSQHRNAERLSDTLQLVLRYPRFNFFQ